VADRPLVDGFLLGLPKCGTTWLAEILSQNPSISFSNPKEPNILASHKGTFGRDYDEPDLGKYKGVFKGDGLRIDGSVHAFSCPESPKRVMDVNPDARFIVCLREPVERAFSHWKMVRDNGADREHGSNWSEFGLAWGDQRLKDDSIWSGSISRWLDIFEIERFLFVDSARMKSEPEEVLDEVTGHLSLDPFEYDLSGEVNANQSRNRRRQTLLGRWIKKIIGLIPESLRGRLSRPLRRRSLNIYNLPIISMRGERTKLSREHYRICEDEVVPDLVRFEEITGFSTGHWLEGFGL
tara:strand:- start:3419 stop:4303 length:885 start_codon:yes stop_codon:yes gene_type:complete